MTWNALLISCLIDQAWLDALNADRKKDQLDKITYETFEIVMDRLEKEWFDLVSPSFFACFISDLNFFADQEPP